MKLPIPSWINKAFSSTQASALFDELSSCEKVRSLTNEEQHWLKQYFLYLSKH